MNHAMESGSRASVRDDSPRSEGQIRLAGSNLGIHRHICAFFNSHDDQYRVLLPFIKNGFDAREKAVHIVDPKRRDEHVRQLRSVGIDVSAAQEEGQLELREWADAHLRGGFFDRDIEPGDRAARPAAIRDWWRAARSHRRPRARALR
jgi:DcmR-like sensory protein